ncbi:MAG: hypothetical protein VST70_01770 [Nitrospirota bacterium]|nr:hypothetical protein [Nitrospirota bacterium]
MKRIIAGLAIAIALMLPSNAFTGTPTTSALVLVGQDPSPGSILSGSPTLSANGLQILQRVTGGVAGCAYLVSFKCATVQGNTLEGQAFFYVVAG